MTSVLRKLSISQAKEAVKPSSSQGSDEKALEGSNPCVFICCSFWVSTAYGLVAVKIRRS